MKTLVYIAGLACVLLAELFWCVKLTLVPVNLAKEPYRRAERAQALTAFAQDRSPERETAFREEMRLASRHVTQRQLLGTGVLFLGFLLIDGCVIFRWKHDPTRTTAA